MNAAPGRAMYLHGFNSSPQSGKARLFSTWCRENLGIEVMVPELPCQPEHARGLLQQLVSTVAAEPLLVVGSSLGGYFATWLVETMGAAGTLKAALINPAVAPCRHHGERFIGRHRNYYTDVEYEFTAADVERLAELEMPALRNPAAYLLLVQTGDELLDYRHALEYYRGCSQVVQSGGSHGFDNFADVLPLIAEFAGFGYRNGMI